MKLPEIIKVTSYDFLIYRVDKNDDFLGQTQADELTIKISKGLDPKVTSMVLLHEVLHAIAYCYGIKFNDHEQEEYLVNVFALALFDVLRNNPELIKIIYNS